MTELLELFFLVLWIATCFVISTAAFNRYNRNGAVWFFAALFASPLLATWWLVLLGRKEPT